MLEFLYLIMSAKMYKKNVSSLVYNAVLLSKILICFNLVIICFSSKSNIINYNKFNLATSYCSWVY